MGYEREPVSGRKFGIPIYKSFSTEGRVWLFFATFSIALGISAAAAEGYKSYLNCGSLACPITDRRRAPSSSGVEDWLSPVNPLNPIYPQMPPMQSPGLSGQ
jgi:hypothetical protein